MRSVGETILASAILAIMTMVSAWTATNDPPKECKFEVRDGGSINRFSMYYYDMEKISGEKIVATPLIFRHNWPQIYNEKGVWTYWKWKRRFTRTDESGYDLIAIDPLTDDPFFTRIWSVRQGKIIIARESFNSRYHELPYDGSRITAISPAEDLVWFGTEGGGIFSLDRTSTGGTKKNYSSSNSELPNDNITALEWMDGVLWIGTNGGGAAAFDGKTWRIFNTENGLLLSNEVNTLGAVSGDEAYVGTHEGISHLKGNASEKVDVPSGGSVHVDSIERDFSDRLWVAAGGKVSVRDKYGWKTFDPTECAGPGAWIDRITLDADGQLWAAGEKHLLVTVFSSTKPTPVVGRVVDPEGKPFKDAIVTSGRDRAVTNENGSFVLELVQSGIMEVDFTVPGLYKPVTKMLRHYSLPGVGKTDMGEITLPVLAESTGEETPGNEVRIAVLSGETASLKIINMQGRVLDEVSLPFGLSGYATFHLSWCEGNKNIMISSSSPLPDHPEPFWLIDMDSKEAKPFLLPDGNAVKGNWASCSPTSDEAVIVFANNIWRINLDGTGLVQITRGQGDFMFEMPQFSPDGNTIVFLKGKEKELDIWITDREGKEAKPLVEKDGYKGYPTYSPDGMKVAFFTMTENFKGIDSVYSSGMDGEYPFDRLSEEHILYHDISWLPEGKGMLFFATVDYYVKLMKYDTSTKSKETIFPSGEAVAVEN